MPPEAIAATRCSTSGDIPIVWLHCNQYFPIKSRAIESPPDADPVMPASVVILIASDISGVPPIFIPINAEEIDLKPSSDATTLP